MLTTIPCAVDQPIIPSASNLPPLHFNQTRKRCAGRTAYRKLHSSHVGDLNDTIEPDAIRVLIYRLTCLERFPFGSRLFVGNLSNERVTKRDMYHVFHRWGKLAQISIRNAYGLIQFRTVEDCNRARARAREEGREVRGKKIQLEPSKPRPKRRGLHNNQKRAKYRPLLDDMTGWTARQAHWNGRYLTHLHYCQRKVPVSILDGSEQDQPSRHYMFLTSACVLERASSTHGRNCRLCSSRDH